MSGAVVRNRCLTFDVFSNEKDGDRDAVCLHSCNIQRKQTYRPALQKGSSVCFDRNQRWLDMNINYLCGSLTSGSFSVPVSKYPDFTHFSDPQAIGVHLQTFSICLSLVRLLCVIYCVLVGNTKKGSSNAEILPKEERHGRV